MISSSPAPSTLSADDTWPAPLVRDTIPAPSSDEFEAGLPLDENDFEIVDSVFGAPVTERNFAGFHELDDED